MKVIQNAIPAITSEGLEDRVSVVGFNEQKIQHVSSVLRDMIYSDKRLAPCRELVANATDEHKKHKITRPVEVSITKEEGSYWLKIRDFAKGLNDHGVRYVWGSYFESTKDQDNFLTGGFGVGAKAIFACSDISTITSFHEGVKTVYSAFLDKDESGVGVSKIVDIHSEETTETGIEVAIPFDAEGLREFDQKIKQVVSNCSPDTAIFYRDLNGTYHKPYQPKESFKFSDEVKVYKTESYSNTGIRMGEIVYPFPKFFNVLGLCQNYVMEVPVGFFSLPISREEISDTPANRKQGERLKELIEQKREEYKEATSFSIKDFCGWGNLERSVFVFKSKDVVGFDVSNLAEVRNNNAKENCVVVIPHNGATAKWRNRIFNVAHLLDEKFNYYKVNGENLIRTIDQIEDVHKVVHVKSLGIAKLEGGYGGNTSGAGEHRVFAFRWKDGSIWSSVKKDSYTISDYLQTIPDKKPETCESLKELKDICVVVDSCVDISGVMHVCQTAKNQLIKTGKVWDWRDSNLTKIKDKLNKKDQEKAKKEEQKKKITQSTGLYSKRTIKIVRENPNHPRIEQLVAALEKAKENPLIADVIKCAKIDQNWNNMKRIHLREIMRKMG